MERFRYYIAYKPYGMLTQFSGEGSTLAELGDFPSDVYPVGRLDKDSEGLLLLTNDKALNHFLLNPRYGHHRTYYVQVEGLIGLEALQQLQKGVVINVEGRDYKTKSARAMLMADIPNLPPRNPPIRYRKNVPDCWISISLTEGKNRQVRKMTAKVGHPTLRLVRWSMEKLTLQGLESGAVREMSQKEVYAALDITAAKVRAKRT